MTEADAKSFLVLNVWTAYGEVICRGGCKLNEPVSYQVSVTNFTFSLWNPAG